MTTNEVSKSIENFKEDKIEEKYIRARKARDVIALFDYMRFQIQNVNISSYMSPMVTFFNKEDTYPWDYLKNGYNRLKEDVSEITNQDLKDAEYPFTTDELYKRLDIIKSIIDSLDSIPEHLKAINNALLSTYDAYKLSFKRAIIEGGAREAGIEIPEDEIWTAY